MFLYLQIFYKFIKIRSLVVIKRVILKIDLIESNSRVYFYYTE